MGKINPRYNRCKKDEAKEFQLEHKPYYNYSDLQLEIRNCVSLTDSFEISRMEGDNMSVSFQRTVLGKSDLQWFGIRLYVCISDNITKSCLQLNVPDNAKKQNRWQTIHEAVLKNSATSPSYPITLMTVNTIFYEILNYDISNYFISKPILPPINYNPPFQINFHMNHIMDRHIAENLRDIDQYFTDDHLINSAFNSCDGQDIENLILHALKNAKNVYFNVNESFRINHDFRKVIGRRWVERGERTEMDNCTAITIYAFWDESRTVLTVITAYPNVSYH